MRLNMDTHFILGPNKGRYGKIRAISLNIFYLTKALTNRAKPYAKVSAIKGNYAQIRVIKPKYSQI